MIISAFSYSFFVRAFLAVVLVCPLLSILGTMIVQRKMSFFSDALGHSAFTGIAIGVILGVSDVSIVMIMFAVLFAIVLNFLSRKNAQQMDSVISVVSSCCIAVGLAILSFGGNFSKYSSLLVGDILSITKSELITVGMLFVVLLVYWALCVNGLAAVSLHRSLAKSRGINAEFIELGFSVIVAIIVMMCVRWIGVLLINALLILPAAASRNIASNLREYHLFALIFSLLSGILGLLVSYFVGIAAGPSIVIYASVIYFATFIFGRSGLAK